MKCPRCGKDVMSFWKFVLMLSPSGAFRQECQSCRTSLRAVRGAVRAVVAAVVLSLALGVAGGAVALHYRRPGMFLVLLAVLGAAGVAGEVAAWFWWRYEPVDRGDPLDAEPDPAGRERAARPPM